MSTSGVRNIIVRRNEPLRQRSPSPVVMEPCAAGECPVFPRTSTQLREPVMIASTVASTRSSHTLLQAPTRRGTKRSRRS